MDVLEIIYHQFIFTARSLGRQPMTCRISQPPAVQTLVLGTAATHCALSEDASEKTIAVMFCQDEYRGTFCPSAVMNFTPEATALVNHSFEGCLEAPPLLLMIWCNYTRTGTPPFLSALLSLN